MGCGGSKPADGGGESRQSYVDKDVELDGPLSKDDLKARIIGNEVAQTFALGESGFTLRYAAVSQRGYYPEDLYKANQDRFIVKPKLGEKPDQARAPRRRPHVARRPARAAQTRARPRRPRDFFSEAPPTRSSVADADRRLRRSRGGG